jgi:hypothetical protein
MLSEVGISKFKAKWKNRICLTEVKEIKIFCVYFTQATPS